MSGIAGGLFGGGQNVGTAHGTITISTNFTSVQQQAVAFARTLENSLAGLRNLANISFAGLGLQQIAQATIAFTELGIQMRQAQTAFTHLAGGSAQATANLRAIQQAASGTVDQLQAMRIGNQAMALGLANTSEQFERLVRAARGVALVSPVIHDVGSAISEIALASANLSFRRLDQLGLSVTEVRQRMDQLRRTNTDLSEQMLFQQAVIDRLNEKYGELADNTVSGLQRMRTAHQDYLASLAAEGTLLDEIANRSAQVIEDYNTFQELLRISRLETANLTYTQKLAVERARELVEAHGAVTRRLNVTPEMRDLVNYYLELAGAMAQAAAAAPAVRTGPVQMPPGMAEMRQFQSQRQAEHEARFQEFQRESSVRNRAAGQQRIEEFEQMRQQQMALTQQIVDTHRRFEEQRVDIVRQYESQRADMVRSYEEQRTDTVRQYESQRADAIQQYEQQRAREAEDYARQRARAEAQFARQVADLHEAAARREAEAATALMESMAEIRADSQERIAKLESDAARAAERAATDHRDTLLEAAARLDARAVAQEQRRFAREEEERQKALQQELTDERTATDRRLAEEQEAFDEQLAAAQAADARRLADMERDFADRQQMEEQDRALHLARAAADQQTQLDSLDSHHQERLARMDSDYQDQLARLDSHHAERLTKLDQAHEQEIAQIARQELERLASQDRIQTNSLRLWDGYWQDWVDTQMAAQNAAKAGGAYIPPERAPIDWTSPTPPPDWIGGWWTDFTPPPPTPPPSYQSPSAQSSDVSASAAGASVQIAPGAIVIHGVSQPEAVGSAVEEALVRVFRSLA